jgi:chromosome segregation ATPase
MKYLYSLVALLALAVVAADHYGTNVYLNLVNNTQTAQAFRQVDIIAADNAIEFASRTQEVCVRQSREIEALDAKLVKAVAALRSNEAESARLMKELERAGSLIKELTDANAALQAGKDDDEEQMKDLGQANEQLAIENARLSQANANLIAKLEVATPAIKKLTEEKLELMKQVKYLTYRIEQLLKRPAIDAVK